MQKKKNRNKNKNKNKKEKRKEEKFEYRHGNWTINEPMVIWLISVWVSKNVEWAPSWYYYLLSGHSQNNPQFISSFLVLKHKDLMHLACDSC